MKYLLLISVLFITSSAAPISEEPQATIVEYKNINNGDGNYEYSFETSNGLLRREQGTVVNKGQPDEHIEVHGSYTYTDPEGNIIVVNYTADENGYHIEKGVGGSIFTGPVNPAVLASLLG